MTTAEKQFAITTNLLGVAGIDLSKILDNGILDNFRYTNRTRFLASSR